MKNAFSAFQHYLRVVILLASATFTLLREDPRGFALKLSERIRQGGVPCGQHVVRLLELFGETESRRRIAYLRERGDLSDAVKAGNTAKRSEQHQARRIAEEIEQLHRNIHPGRSLSPVRGEPRVLFVLTNSLPFTQSGYTLRSHETMLALKARGIHVSAVTRLGYPVVTGRVPRRSADVVDGVKYARLLPLSLPKTLEGRNALAVEAVVDEARQNQATLLHTTTDFKNAIVTSEAAKILGIPWIYEVRGELEKTWLSKRNRREQSAARHSEFYISARRQETNAMKSASAVIVLSEVAQSNLIRRGVPEKKITVVPNAVDSNLIGREYSRRAIREELGLDKQLFIAGTVTSVVDYEGLDYFVRALLLLPQVTGLIVGDGSALPGLKRLVKELGLSNRVIFAGRKPAEGIWKWYAALDVFVVPRKNTGVCKTVTPIKALTAQALGIPVVASDLPALREVTGGRAFYVAPESVRSLADGIVAAGESSGEYCERDWLLARTWESNGEKLASLYRGLHMNSESKE